MGLLMDVKDYSQKLVQEREKFRNAEDGLRASYEKNTEDMKENFDYKTKKLGKNYEAQKSELEEQNLVNNQLYSEKTKNIIAQKQEGFRNDIKKNTEKFDSDRNVMKSNFNDKLANLSESYKKSTIENNRFHNQAAKTMGERYSKANQNYKSDFDGQVERLNEKTKEQFLAIKSDAKKERERTDKDYQGNLENLRTSNEEQKFKEVSRLRNDNENLRTNFAQEKGAMADLQESRIEDVLKLKRIESEEGQKNFSNLQNDIRKKSVAEEERVKISHQAEAKELNKRFNDDIRVVKKMSNQKILGGNEVATLKDENKRMAESYESRMANQHSEAAKNMRKVLESEKEKDANNRDKIKELKSKGVEDLYTQEAGLNAKHKISFQEARDKTNSLVDRYKMDLGKSRVETEEKLSKADYKSKNQLRDQRVEFGKYVNNANERKMEEITSIKDELSKDKTNFIEKTRRDYSEEKNVMKEDFNRQIAVKENLYEAKLAEMEKQTNKIIENYENRMGQIVRKTEKEVNAMKAIEAERNAKESLAKKIAFDNIQSEHQAEISNIRGKYETVIGKDRAVNELQTTRIVQKYEDQLDRERIEHQKEISMRLSESQAQFERLFKASELEKETLRTQYEQRMENMKSASLAQGNSKKS